MDPFTDDQPQAVEPLNLDVVDELERIVRRLGQITGQVTIEAVFLEGSYLRGFVKRGPITAEQMRELGGDAG